MKKVQTQLKSVAKSLASLAERMEKLSDQVTGEPVKKKTVAKKKAAPKKKAPVKKAPAGKETVLETVLGVIKKCRNGADIATLKAKTQLESRQLSNALYKLSKKNMIKSKARGVYIKA